MTGVREMTAREIEAEMNKRKYSKYFGRGIKYLFKNLVIFLVISLKNQLYFLF